MAIVLDHSNVYEGSALKPEGDYEVVVKEAKLDTLKDGREYINIALVVRNDCPQGYRNAYIWASLWKGKESGEFNMKQINTIGKALNIPTGKQYADWNALLADFNGKAARVTIKHEEYNGNTNERVAFWNVTKFPAVAHQWKDANSTGSMPGTEVSADDCPF